MAFSKNIILFISANVCVIYCLLGQSPGLHGYIYDKETSEPLIGASILLEGTSFGTATDITGNYHISGIPVGTYNLQISYLGYENLNEKVEILPDLTKEMNFYLSYSGVQFGAVTITAQAKGQAKAINDQLNSNVIKNVIASEKIQELPDANAAETISRLPGVSVQRTGGEGSKVVVRGLSPKYTSMMVEGVNMATSENDRSADISAISPYSLGGIELLKAITADKDANFVGGSINFILQEAKNNWHANIIMQAGYNGLKKSVNDYLFTGSISNRFFNQRFGVFAQINAENRNRSSNDQGATYNIRELDGNKKEIHTTNLILSDIYRQTKRLGATLVLDYKIKDGKIFLKNFYSSGATDINRYNEVYNLANTNRTFSHETYQENYNNNALNNILSYEQRFGKMLIQSTFANSFSNKNVPSNFSFIFEQRNAIKSEVLNSIIPPYDLLNYTVVDDSNSFLETINEISSKTEEKQNSFTVDLQYDWSLSKQISGFLKFGGKYQNKNRFYDKTHYFGRLRLNSGQQAKDAILTAYPEFQNVVPLGSTSLPFSIFANTNFDHGNYLDGEYALGAVAEVGILNNVLDIIKHNVGEGEFQTFGLHQYFSEREDYAGEESLYAGYIMSEINIGTKIKLIPGWRYENNTTTYNGPYGDATATAFPELNYYFIDTTVTRSNSFLLPMMHVRYKPFSWFDVRIAYTHTLSRPSYFQFTPRQDILSEVVILNNHQLQPEYSKNIDVYLSFRDNKLGLFTLGTFHKKIGNMIFGLDRRVILDPKEYNLPESTKNRVIFTQANNDRVAALNGIEIDWQTHFWYLPGLLKGLVINLNYTHIYSKADYPRTVIELGKLDPVTFMREQLNIDSYLTDRLVDQPNDIFNFQIGYDYKDFSVRISTLYQSRVFKGTNFYPELTQFTEAYNRWDMSFKQSLPLKGFKVFCNLNNLTNASDRNRISGAPWNTKIQQYGRSIDLGVRFEFEK